MLKTDIDMFKSDIFGFQPPKIEQKQQNRG